MAIWDPSDGHFFSTSMKYFSILVLIILLACNEEPPKVDFPVVSISDIEVSEGNVDREIFVNLVLSAPFEQSVTLTLNTTDGTALADSDYEGLNNEIVIFEPFDLAESVSLTVIGDPVFEEDETFQVEITSAENAEVENSTATVTLSNDDVGTYALIWSDEFNSGLSPDWTYEIGGSGWGNNEWQYYTDQNTSVSNGNLVIEARKEGFGGRSYTSSRIITKDKFDFKYGRVDIRAAMPEGQGLWPALWMLGANFSQVGWPGCGEIDIMEMIGGSDREKTVHGTLHWQDVPGPPGSSHAQYGESFSLSSGTFSDDFHLFTIEWDQDGITWYVDGNLSHTIGTTSSQMSDEFNNNFFLIFNVAVGGNWPGYPDASTQFPQRMIVDYVRVYQQQ